MWHVHENVLTWVFRLLTRLFPYVLRKLCFMVIDFKNHISYVSWNTNLDFFLQYFLICTRVLRITFQQEHCLVKKWKQLKFWGSFVFYNRKLIMNLKGTSLLNLIINTTRSQNCKGKKIRYIWCLYNKCTYIKSVNSDTFSYIFIIYGVGKSIKVLLE